MMQSLNTAATGMVAQQYNLDTIANNLANVNTTAFKRQRAEFEDLMYNTIKVGGTDNGETTIQPVPIQIGLGANFSSTAPSFAQGPMQQTGNPLDLAINGEGFFEVKRGEQQAFTRDGSFKTDSQGNVVTSDGFLLEPAINIPVGSTAVNVAPDGTVTAVIPGNNEPQVVGNITVSVFPNPSGLTRVGQNLYVTSNASGEASSVTPGAEGAGIIQSSYLEGSNVQVVEEMVRMILAQRAYEINSKAIQTADEMLSVLNRLAS